MTCSSRPGTEGNGCGGGCAPGSPLACGGYGSAVTVTATMGFAAAAIALEHLQAAA